MICPVKSTNEMSALSGTLSGRMTRYDLEATERSRSGAGNETTERNVARDTEMDHFVAGGGSSACALKCALEARFT
jgi:hypothetical protein